MTPKILFVLILIALFGVYPIYTQEATPDSFMTISLKDGSVLQCAIIQKDDASVTVRTLTGLEIKVPKAAIVSIKPIQGLVVAGTFQRFDPNYSRLLFAPTGRPLRQGDGYFSDYYVFFPGVAYGFTNNISLMAGMSIFPGLSLKNQLKYIAPRIGLRSSDRFAASIGALYINFINESSAGIAFAVGTFGQQDKSFTAGIGLGYIKEEGEDFEFAKHPIIMLGGNIRLSNSTALITENWLITSGDFKIGQQPFSLALRFFGDRLAADVGFIIIGEVIEEGFPIPWLSFVYNFDR